jgi:hypothetical protein
MSKFLDQLIAERDRLSIAIDVLQEREGAVNGATLSRVRRGADAALVKFRLDPPNGNGNGHAPTRRPYKRRQVHHDRKSPYRGAGRDVVEVPVPKDLDVTSLEFPEAIAMAVRAVGEPIPTPELTSLLKRSGVKMPKASRTMPPQRYVGLIAGHLVRAHRLKKTATGWVAGSK